MTKENEALALDINSVHQIEMQPQLIAAWLAEHSALDNACTNKDAHDNISTMSCMSPWG